MVAKKDVHLAKHPELADKNVPNLHVMKAMLVRTSLIIMVLYSKFNLHVMKAMLVRTSLIIVVLW